jgi:integrase
MCSLAPHSSRTTSAPSCGASLRPRHAPVRRNLTRWYKRILRKAGLDEAIRLHDLRHTAITDWIAAGADPKVAQALASHATAQTTINIYAQARDELKRDAVEHAEQRRRAAR